MGLRYGKIWKDHFANDVDLAAGKAMYKKALFNYLPSTILRAIDTLIVRSSYPDLAMLVSICEEFSKTNRYEFHQPKELPAPSSEAARLKAIECRAEIRKFIDSVLGNKK